LSTFIPSIHSSLLPSTPFVHSPFHPPLNSAFLLFTFRPSVRLSFHLP
jgi:hypothetical protein